MIRILMISNRHQLILGLSNRE